MEIVIARTVGKVEVAQLDFLLPKEEEVSTHYSYHWCEEDSEGTEDGDEGCCFVDQLPGLDDLRSVSLSNLAEWSLPRRMFNIPSRL
jgi:hypothetical protein